MTVCSGTAGAVFSGSGAEAGVAPPRDGRSPVDRRTSAPSIGSRSSGDSGRSIPRNWRATSAALAGRRFGSFAVNAAIRARTAAGISARGAGIAPRPSVVSIASRVPGMRYSPVSRRWSVHPSEKRSLRPSIFSSRTCSGDRKGTLPLITPATVRVTRSAARAMPKSVSFTSPLVDTRMFAGFTSRCTMPSGAPSSRASECA